MVLMIMAVVMVLPIIFQPARGENDDHKPNRTWAITQIGARAESIDRTRDGGYVAAGVGFGGWAVKTNAEGEPEWDNYYTVQGYTFAGFSNVRQTSDGGYILAGGGVSFHLSTGTDSLLIKLDQRGNVEWSKAYGGPKDDYFTMAEQTADGGYVAVGNNEMIGPHISNGWVVKVGPTGNIVWEDTFPGDDVNSLALTNDGGFVGSGAVGLSDNNPGVWLFKLDSTGNLVWQTVFDVADQKYPALILRTSSQQTIDGGYVLAAEVVNRTSRPWFSRALIMRLDTRGSVLWQKLYGDGTDQFTSPNSIVETSNGEVVVSGRSTGPFLMVLGAIGNLRWQKIYGGTNDFFLEAHQTRDQGFAVVGDLSSTGAWIVKTDSKGRIEDCPIGVFSSSTLADVFINVTNATTTIIHTGANVTETVVAVAKLSSPVQTICPTLNGLIEDNHHRPPSISRFQRGGDDELLPHEYAFQT